MATADVGTIAQFDLLDLLQSGATGACMRLNELCEGTEPLNQELRLKFQTAVANVEKVTIEALAGTAGAFVLDNGHLRMAEAPVSRLLTVVLQEIEARFDDGRATVERNEIPKLLEQVFVGYVLHEVRHMTQGLEKLADVHALKDIAGPAAMSEYDTLADRDAALAFAALYAEDGTRGAFLRVFRDALFFSTNYFFQVFPIPTNRPDKIARAMAILFMAARLAKRDLDEIVEEAPELPLDTPLYVSLSEATKRIAVHRGEPTRELLGIANDKDGVGDLIEQICDGDFDAALGTSIGIMEGLRLMG